MQINLFATFRMLAGVKRFDLNLPAGATLGEAVQAVAAAYPVLRPHWLDEAGEVHAHVHVFVNGEEALTLPDTWDTALQPDDVLDFFPPVAGGS